MKITIKGDKLVVSFKYEPDLVTAIKEVSGRQFNPAKKIWEVPKENILELLESFSRRGIRMTIGNDVIALATEAERMQKEVMELKETPAKYSGSLPLYDFQKIGASFLMTMPGALLADVPGLGKTIQTIAACENLGNNILILCPASLKYGWHAEIKKWNSDRDALVIDGDKERRKLQWGNFERKNPIQFTIANYELLFHDQDVMPKEWTAIVCDEATRIANPNAQTTKALKRLIAGKRIALTGTPVSNSPVDLYSILDWISPGVLGSYFQFLNEYCVREPRFNRIVSYKNLDKLERIAGRFMLRRTKAEVLKDFPPKTIEDIIFPLSIEESELYHNIRYQIVEELKDGLEKNLSILPVKMLRLKQTTDDARLVQEFAFNEGSQVIKSSKLKALKDLLEPIIASGEKAIVFTQFAEMCDLLRVELGGKKIADTITDPPFIKGDLDAETRHKMVEQFNTDPFSQIIIMTEAGAYGLNLQAATYVIHYDMPWSIAKLMQREDRAHRIGQSKPVTVYNLIARGTIDEYVMKVLKRKNETSVKILGDDDRLEDAGLTPEDIKAILRIA